MHSAGDMPTVGDRVWRDPGEMESGEGVAKDEEATLELTEDRGVLVRSGNRTGRDF